jgi:hypothetical protein
VKKSEVEYRILLEDYFARSIGSNVEKLQNFAKYVPVQDLRKFLNRYEIFKRILHVHGSIVECGILFGGGLMTWAVLSEIFEPLNHLRNVIGFDTFSGFTSLADEDKTAMAQQARIGGLAADSYGDLMESVDLFDRNRFLGHIRKVKLVKGDIGETASQYLRDNPHTVISLLVLDLDSYEPTAAALKHFVPRMPKGAVIVFDELNHEVWPGETVAVARELGLRALRLQRVPWGSTMSYAVID